MIFLRRLIRLILVSCWFFLITIWTMSRFPFGWGGIRRASFCTRRWAAGMCRIIGLRVRVSGKIPEHLGGLLVSNHLSYLDILAHGSLLPIRFTPKSDILSWPVINGLVMLSRPIWVDRGSRQKSKAAMQAFSATMQHGIPLIIYPEGTSTDGKHGLLHFKSTPFQAAVDGNFPIFPILIRYRESASRPTVCWYGGMTLLPHIWQVLGFNQIECEVKFLAPIQVTGRDRKSLAAFIHEEMEREYHSWNSEPESGN